MVSMRKTFRTMPKELPLSFFSMYNSGARHIEEVMMKVREIFQQVRSIRIPKEGDSVERTVAKELLDVV
jgi:hypothetical protein